MKRALFIVVPVLVLLLAIMLVAKRLNSRAGGSLEGLAHIPTDAMLVVRANEWRSLAVAAKRDRPIWEALTNLHVLGEAVAALSTLDSTVALGTEYDVALRRGECYISLHPEGNGAAATLMVLRFEGLNPDLNQLAELLLPRHASMTYERAYNHATLWGFVVHGNGGKPDVYLSTKGGVALLATTPLLLEKALRMDEAHGGLREDPVFADLYEQSARREAANVYLHPPRLMPYISRYLASDLAHAAKALEGWCGWIATDAKCSHSDLVLNGVSRLSDSIKQTSSTLKGHRTAPLKAPRVLPANTALLLRWGARGSEKLGDWLEKNLQPTLDASYTQKHYQADLKLFRRMMVEELALAYVPSTVQGEAGNWLLTLATESPSQAIDELALALGPGLKERAAKLDRGESYTLYSQHRPELFRRLFGRIVPAGVGQYFTAVDRFLVFSTSPQQLQRVVLANTRKQTLQEADHWHEMSDAVQSDCNFALYLSPASLAQSSELLSKLGNTQVSTDAAALANLSGAALQLSATGDIVFYNCVVHQGQVLGREARTIWQTRLDAPLVGRPWLMNSHVAKGKEVMAQDARGMLYLISGQGRVLWRKPLDMPILGEPQQVDVYRNGKLQYAFVTPQALWVVDRNGNDVAGFPVKLVSEAVAPLAVFDYENRRDYRLMVALANRTVGVWDANGRRVVGFNARTETALVAEPALYQHGGKDFIVLCDSNRLYLLNRRGEERLRLKLPIRRATNSTLGFSSRTPTLYVVGENGSLYTASLADGTVKSVSLARWGAGGASLLLDLNGDGVPEVVAIQGDTFSVHSVDGAAKVRQRLEVDMVPRIQPFHFGSTDWRFGILDANARRVWLLNAKGDPCTGFPIEGGTLFSIGHLQEGEGRFNLLTGGAGDLLLNYAVAE